MLNREFTIDFNGINEVIGFLSRSLDNNLPIQFDPETNSYIVDDVKISMNFLAETQTKMSHYINTVNRLILNANSKYQNSLSKIKMNEIVSNFKNSESEPEFSFTPSKVTYVDDHTKENKEQAEEK